MDPKKTIKVGTWNVRTMYQVSKTAQVIKEMDRYNIAIMGIGECRWTGSGKTVSINHTIIFSGRADDQHKEGVGLIMNKESAKSLIEWEPINERLIKARFNSTYAKTTIIQCYSPTNDAEDEVKDAYYEALQTQIVKTPQHDVLLIIGDQNAKVGNDNSQHERSMGREGLGIMNENGERLADFCSTNGLVIGGTLFKHKGIHKITWNSPNNRDKNQIDHVIINGKWRRSLLDTRSYSEADVNSDHHLIISKVRLKLKKAESMIRTCRKIIDTKQLYDAEVKKKFCIELKNRLKALEDLSQMEEIDLENKWENIKQVYQETAEKTIVFRRKNDKQWLTQDTWTIIDERRKIKEKVLNTKSLRLKEQLQKEYNQKNKEVKRSARKDKRNFIETRAEEAEKAAKKTR
ncbi:craniofacial development protein 2-like [Mytilus edulis]|uniref:craniofacial development protein 2-like n=1 Tax=Mytilus edulis TaxID=6550 RepID=UPI0039EF4D60